LTTTTTTKPKSRRTSSTELEEREEARRRRRNSGSGSGSGSGSHRSRKEGAGDTTASTSTVGSPAPGRLRKLEREKHVINRNSSSFYHAVMTNNAAKVERLLKTKPKCVFDVDTFCHHPVFDVVCAKPNSLPLLIKMVDLGVDPSNCECDKGTIPLYSAIMAWSTFKTDEERKKILWLLIEAKARIDPVKSRPIGSPLTKATELGDWTLVKRLIDCGANVNLVTKAGLTPLCFAALINSVTITKLLIQHGARVNPVSYSRDSLDGDVSMPLVQAAGEGHIDVAKVLLEHGAAINAIDGVEGVTALMKAAKHGRLEMCRFLIEKGADVNSVTRLRSNSKKKSNALSMARRHKHARVAELLLHHGAQTLAIEPSSPNCTVS